MSSMTTRLDSRYLIDPAASSGAQLTATTAEINAAVDGLTATAAELTAVADQSAGYGFRAYTGAVSVLTTAETNIVTLPAGAIVLDVLVNITTAETTACTKTIDVGTQGTSNDPNGFLTALSTAATGIFSARQAFTLVTGLNETYISAVNVGALFYRDVAPVVGTDLNLDTGQSVTSPWFVATADPVSYTLASAHTELDATISVIYIDVAGI